MNSLNTTDESQPRQAEASLFDSNRISPEQLELIVPPPPTRTWQPVSHSRVFDLASEAITEAGYKITKSDLAVTNGGKRFFGTLDLRSEIADGVTLAVGLRNSTDKSIAAGFCAGERVFVCSNLSFSGEIKVSRKHTAGVEADFRAQIAAAIASLKQHAVAQRHLIASLSRRILRREVADSLILKGYQRGIVKTGVLPKLLEEWTNPSYQEFETRTAWSLFNAFTHVQKARFQKNPAAAALETMAFQKLLSH